MGQRAAGGGRQRGGGQRGAGSRGRAEKRGKCPSCGGSEYDEGTLALYNSISYVVFSSKKRPFVTLGNSLRSRVCLGCGRVEFYAPRRAFNKTSGKGASGKGTSGKRED
jgi:predicted nucleic-acid-binding Zn-ribbon protein